MASLACMLYDLGHEVKGSDVKEDFGFEEGLFKRKIEILEFNEENISGDYEYIIGNAYGEKNVEVKKVKELDFKYSYYHKFISKLKGIHIGIAGTHGKTTTTKMIVDMLKGEKIAYIIGDGTGGAVKDYKYLIYEACEYKDHFLSYRPDILVLGKVEFDHPDYFSSIDDVFSSFNKLISNSKNVITKDSNCVKKRSNFITFGNTSKDYKVRILKEGIEGFEIEINDEKITLPFYGYHMVDNFVSAYITLKRLGYSNNFIKSKVKNIVLPKRRFEEERFEKQIIVKDYGHHPTEIKALYDALKQKYPKREQIVLFQPHTYSRTLSLNSEFDKALSLFDKVYVFPTFTSSRENVDLRLDAQVKKVFEKYQNVEKVEAVEVDKGQRIYIFLGAGTIHKDVEKLKMKIMKIN